MTEIMEKIIEQRKSLDKSLEEMMTRSNKDKVQLDERIKYSKERTEQLKNSMKVSSDYLKRGEDLLAAAEPKHHNSEEERQMSEETREAYKKLREFMNTDSEQHSAEAKLRRGAGSRSANVLTAHGVTKDLVLELNRMAGSSFTRDALVEHVATHFPDKKKNEWNDIVVAALVEQGRTISGSDLDAALKNNANLQHEKFRLSKDSFETRNDL
jgi:hypothetical protein